MAVELGDGEPFKDGEVVTLPVGVPIALRLAVGDTEPETLDVGDAVRELEPVGEFEHVAETLAEAECEDDSDGSAPIASPRNTGRPSSRSKGVVLLVAVRMPASQAAPPLPPTPARRTPAVMMFDGTSWLTLASSTHGAVGCDGESSWAPKA